MVSGRPPTASMCQNGAGFFRYFRGLCRLGCSLACKRASLRMCPVHLPRPRSLDPSDNGAADATLGLGVKSSLCRDLRLPCFRPASEEIPVSSWHLEDRPYMIAGPFNAHDG